MSQATDPQKVISVAENSKSEAVTTEAKVAACIKIYRNLQYNCIESVPHLQDLVRYTDCLQFCAQLLESVNHFCRSTDKPHSEEKSLQTSESSLQTQSPKDNSNAVVQAPTGALEKCVNAVLPFLTNCVPEIMNVVLKLVPENIASTYAKHMRQAVKYGGLCAYRQLQRGNLTLLDTFALALDPTLSMYIGKHDKLTNSMLRGSPGVRIFLLRQVDSMLVHSILLRHHWIGPKYSTACLRILRQYIDYEENSFKTKQVINK